MRKTVALLFVIAASGCASSPTTNGHTAAELLSLQDQWAKARIAQDVSFLESFYRPDFRVISLDGSQVSRADDIANFATKILKPESIVDRDMDVRIYGDTAVVTGREDLRGTYRGNAGAFTLRFTNVYVFENGKWALAHHHATPSAPQ